MPIKLDPKDLEQQKRLGVTNSIRAKLNFLDERLWKRFSARRLELIDTLDLSSKKASEQDAEIRKVAEALRVEFNYNPDYESDFDKLVRAAVQSVRRNRKRSSKSKRNHNEEGTKRPRIIDSVVIPPTYDNPDIINSYSGLPNTTSPPDSLGLQRPNYHETETEYSDPNDSHNTHNGKTKFLSEISRLNSDSNDDIYDLSYPRAKNFTANDKARATIDSMIRPRIGNPVSSEVKSVVSVSATVAYNGHSNKYSGTVSGANSSISNPISSHTTRLPPITDLQIDSRLPHMDVTAAKGIIINHIERSKSCSESISKKSENLQALGQSVMSASIAYVFEKSFEAVNDTSVEYLRSKLNSETFLSRFFRELDPNVTTSITDEIAVISLYTLLGGCVKDFGFDTILVPLCEIIYVSILQQYPLISKNSTPFRSADYLKPSEYSNSLSSLAAVASDLQSQEVDQVSSNSELHRLPLSPPSLIGAVKVPTSSATATVTNTTNTTSTSLNTSSTSMSIPPPPLPLHTGSNLLIPEPKYRKQVYLHYLSQALEFSYLTKNSAPPRFIELLENARSAFKLAHLPDSILGLRDVKTGNIIQTDFDLERIFRNEEKIELEVFAQRSTAIPIYEITSTVVPSRYGGSESPKIILPPPFGNRPHLSHSRSPTGEQGVGDHPRPGFNFLSNSDDMTPPPPLLPKFQPLL